MPNELSKGIDGGLEKVGGCLNDLLKAMDAPKPKPAIVHPGWEVSDRYKYLPAFDARPRHAPPREFNREYHLKITMPDGSSIETDAYLTVEHAARPGSHPGLEFRIVDSGSMKHNG